MSVSRSGRSRARSRAYERRQSVPVTRQSLLRLGLYWGTLFVIVVGSCTLTFWFLASSTGLFNIAAPELFVIRSIGIVGLLLGAAGLFFIVGALRRVTLPIRAMEDGARRIAEGNYDLQITEDGPRELRGLARSFNQMAAQLKQNDEERRNLIANIASELRTPLSMVQENIEGLIYGNFARDDAHLNLILGETIRLSHLADELRMLALASSGGLILQREPTDLNALVMRTLEIYHRDASAHDIALHGVLQDPGPIALIDPGRIQEVIGNLINNALRENLKSDIRVEVTTVQPEPKIPPKQAQIEVAYRGIIIGASAIPGYFDRFWETDAARTAQPGDSGLELAIAKLLVQAHGGDITISNDSRSGTHVTFTLPLAPSD